MNQVDSATCADGSCCSYSELPGLDQFNRGWDTAGKTQGSMAVPGFVAPNATSALVKVDAFFLDDFEVTVGRFRTFLSTWLPSPPEVPDSYGVHPSDTARISGWDRKWNEQNNTNGHQLWATLADDLYADIKDACGANGAEIVDHLRAPTAATDRQPMTCVTWFEAFMFCVWDDARDARARLPIETEWGYAAVGGDKYLPYPWQAAPATPPRSLDEEARAHANVAPAAGPSVSLLLDEVGTHVGGLPSYFGPRDLAGNAYEMVRDWVSSLALTAGAPVISAGGGKELDGAYQYIVRGGSFYADPIFARAVARKRANQRYADTGWRCARDAIK